jgi:hypothetical protein
MALLHGLIALNLFLGFKKMIIDIHSQKLC